MAKKAEEKKAKASEEKPKKAAAKQVSPGFFLEEKKAEKDSHKAEKHDKRHAPKEEAEEKKHGHKEEKHEKGHAKKAEEKHGHKEEEKKARKEEEERHAKKGHGHKAEEKEMALGETGEIEGHGKHGKNRKPKKGKQHKVIVELKPAEITEAIVHLANEGHSASEIGMILRDQYGVPMVGKAMGKKLCAILREHNLLPSIPDDMMSLIRKSVTLRGHLAKNRKDMSAKRGLMLTVSKIRALEKYYKQKGVLPIEWRYSAETASLLAK